MPNLNIKTTHKPIQKYYTELKKYAQLGEENEGTVRAAFQNPHTNKVSTSAIKSIKNGRLLNQKYSSNTTAVNPTSHSSAKRHALSPLIRGGRGVRG